MNPRKRDSSNFYQFSWIPQSHQLIFSGTKYIVQAERLSHAIPQGVYLVDTNQGSVTVLAEAAENLRFLPSRDGKQIALMSPSVDMAESVVGPQSDLKTLADSQLLARLPPGVSALADLAYLGIDKLHPNGRCPVRKPKGKPHTPEQIAFNTAFSRQRIIVEHTICRLRRFESLTQTDRHHCRKHPARVVAVAGLVNRRLRLRFPYAA